MAQMPFEQSGDELTKMILAAAAFTALTAPPVLPSRQDTLNQQRQLGVGNRDYMFAPRSNQDAMDRLLFGTAHDFCPVSHGDND
jgi:hypothetical protein